MGKYPQNPSHPLFLIKKRIRVIFSNICMRRSRLRGLIFLKTSNTRPTITHLYAASSCFFFFFFPLSLLCASLSLSLSCLSLLASLSSAHLSLSLLSTALCLSLSHLIICKIERPLLASQAPLDGIFLVALTLRLANPHHPPCLAKLKPSRNCLLQSGCGSYF